MSSPVEDLENFRIPLEEIKSATEEFNEENLFAYGYYSKLYKGQLSESWENRTAAFKKFDLRRKEEFLNELKFISKLEHENIIPFLGYCHEGEEMVIVYEYPVMKNLAVCLSNPDIRSRLTWALRLLICYYAARGLEYLHSGLGQHGKVIHGYFMEGNIFLGEKFEAKICGFEISRSIPGDQVPQQVYRPHEPGHIRPHMDPVYLDNWFLKVESDVYSFGVLLFNMLTRPDAFRNESTGGDSMPESITMAVQHHFHNRLDSVIDPAIRDQIDSQSFRMIEEITCKCLSYNIKDRPTMYTLVMTIKDALEIHARSHSKDGSYISSVLTYIRPSSESSPNKNDKHLKPIQSLPNRWKDKDISYQRIPLDTYDEDDDAFNPREQNTTQSSVTSIKSENKEVSNGRDENGDQGSEISTSSSEAFEDAAKPNNPTTTVIDLNIDSLFISPELYQCLQSSIPNIVKGCQWVLLYSTVKHGISLRTLIRKSADLSGPSLLITGDTQGAVFGGLVNCPLNPTPKRKYQGTYETFVFTTLYGAPRLFRPTGANRYFYMCLNNLLALGGGGNFALSLDEDLLNGTSGRCDTFGNQCLAHEESFALKNVELWGFAHSSRYP